MACLRFAQETVPLNHQMRSLGQKYMGIRPDSHVDAIFKDTSVHVDANHPVPVSNFMNAQCMLTGNALVLFPDICV